MSNASSTEVISLCERRRDRDMDEAWTELVQAVAALKDSERHLLRTFMVMKSLKVHPAIPEALEAWASTVQEATENCTGFVGILSDELGYEDPFDLD